MMDAGYVLSGHYGGLAFPDTKPPSKQTVTRQLAMLNDAGFAVSPFAQALIRNCAGERYHFDGPIRWCHFDVCQATQLFPKKDCLEFVEIIGEEVCPVGYCESYLFLASERGQTYLLHEQWFNCFRATSLDRLAEFLVSGEKSAAY